MGYDFEVQASAADEISSGAPEDVAAVNARLKAQAVAQLNPDAAVIGSDTVVAVDDAVLGKPADLETAATFLRRLSGREHRVITAVALICDHECVEWIETAKVRFKPLTGAAIAKYLSMVNVLDKAGAYAIQEHGDLLVAGIDGEIETVVGLPLHRLRRELKKIMPSSAATP